MSEVNLAIASNPTMNLYSESQMQLVSSVDSRKMNVVRNHLVDKAQLQALEYLVVNTSFLNALSSLDLPSCLDHIEKDLHWFPRACKIYEQIK